MALCLIENAELTAKTTLATALGLERGEPGAGPEAGNLLGCARSLTPNLRRACRSGFGRESVRPTEPHAHEGILLQPGILHLSSYMP